MLFEIPAVVRLLEYSVEARIDAMDLEYDVEEVDKNWGIRVVELFEAENEECVVASSFRLFELCVGFTSSPESSLSSRQIEIGAKYKIAKQIMNFDCILWKPFPKITSEESNTQRRIKR